MKTFCFIFILIFPFTTLADQTKAGTNVVYKYKKYESFDLGDLEITGNIIAPGDLSVNERERKKFDRALLNRLNFNDEIIKDIKSLR